MTRDRRSEFMLLFEPVHDRLYRYALAVMGDPEDAKDLVGDTVLAAFEQFDTLREPDRFLHFLIAIASRKSKRRMFRRRRFVPLEDALTQKLASSHLSIEAATELSIILDLLQKLPSTMRETFVLFEVADLTLDEIRELQGGSLSGVKSRLVRARRKLSVMLRSVDDTGRREMPSARPTIFERTTLAFVERYGE